MSKNFSIHNLTFRFDDTVPQWLFTGAHCFFKQNALNFIRGKNGSGKSTLFRILTGRLENLEQVSGIITLDGTTWDLASQEDRSFLKSHMRLAPQKFDQMLADQFTFPQNLQLASLPQYPGLAPFKETATIPPLVDRFGIDYTVPVGMLSGGQRQILAILMALQKSASILLLDEPTAALDDKNSSMVMSFLNELLATDKNLTVLIICHDKELVDTYAHSQYHQIEVHDDNTRTIELKTID
jgi:ABC-type lipoprotein export system ATPase subunit